MDDKITRQANTTTRGVREAGSETARTAARDDAESPQHPLTEEEIDARIGISELTGLPYIKARPGYRKITSEEIYKMLEDFP